MLVSVIVLDIRSPNIVQPDIAHVGRFSALHNLANFKGKLCGIGAPPKYPSENADLVF